MDLRHLRTFIALSEFKNFTKTAEHLNYAQSYVTTQIQQLEEELNVRLFERIGKNISLTPDGTTLIPYAQKIITTSQEIPLLFANQEKGRIAVGATESICIYKLPPILTSFQKKFPNVELYINVLDTTDFSTLLANNSIDIAFLLGTPVCNSSFITELQIDEAIGAFSKPDHLLAQKSKVSITDFADVPLILTSKQCCYRKKFDKDLSEAGIPPKIVLETSSVQVIKQAALSGLGVCVLPVLAVREEINNGKLVMINYDMKYGIMTQLIYHKDKWISKCLKDFVDMTKSIVTLTDVSI